MWFMVNHCKDFAAEGNFTETIMTTYASDADAQFMIRRDVTTETCRASRYVNAYTQYSSDTKKWDEWLDPTATTAEPIEDESFTTTAAVGLMLALLAWK
jgi:hypothetical protein